MRFVPVVAAALVLGLAGAVGPSAVGQGGSGGGAADASGDSEPEVLVVLKTGERIHGRLVEETPDEITLRIAGVKTRIKRENVDHFVRQRTPMQRYRSMRSIIDDEDVPRLLLLVEWLRQQRLYEVARAELDAILEQEPTNPDAQRLSRLVDQQLALQQRAEEATPAPVDPDAEAPERTDDQVGPTPFEPGEFPLLTEEQVNLLKVYEVDLNDPPKLLIDRDVVTEFLQRYRGAPGLPRTEAERDRFYSKPASEILGAMFRARARDLYGRVQVLELPTSLEHFRDNVAATWLTRNCGSIRCHGGKDAGPPYIYIRRRFNERSFLTNFLILDRFRFEDGSPMIDYDRPSESALLQLALPRAQSTLPHPDVPGWKPGIRERDSRQFREALAWLDAMIRPHPEYPIEYEPPRPHEDRDGSEGGSGADEDAGDGLQER